MAPQFHSGLKLELDHSDPADPPWLVRERSFERSLRPLGVKKVSIVSESSARAEDARDSSPGLTNPAG